MKKFLSVIAVLAITTMVLPSCSNNNDFDDIVVNQIDEPGSTDQDPKGENEKPGKD